MARPSSARSTSGRNAPARPATGRTSARSPDPLSQESAARSGDLAVRGDGGGLSARGLGIGQTAGLADPVLLGPPGPLQLGQHPVDVVLGPGGDLAEAGDTAIVE